MLDAQIKNGKIEKNHEYIRYIIPKGTPIDQYTQNDISKMLSHINSVPRASLNFLSPFDVASLILGSDVLNALNIQKILPDDIILKRSLLDK